MISEILLRFHASSLSKEVKSLFKKNAPATKEMKLQLKNKQTNFSQLQTPKLLFQYLH